MVREYDGFSSVCYDDAGAVNLLMDRLHRQGHRHIGYLGVQLSDATTGQRRYQAYLDACERLKLTPRATLGELSYQSGFQHAAEVIDSHTSALICASDSIATGRSNTFSNSRRTPFRCAPSATPAAQLPVPRYPVGRVRLRQRRPAGGAAAAGAAQRRTGIRRPVVPSKLS